MEGDTYRAVAMGSRAPVRIRRIYEVDPLTCSCGAQMRILAFILDPRVVTKILRHIAENAPREHEEYARLLHEQAASLERKLLLLSW